MKQKKSAKPIAAGSGGRRPEVAGWREESPALPILLLVVAGLQMVFALAMYLVAQAFIWQFALVFFLLSAGGAAASFFLFSRFRGAAVALRIVSFLVALAPALLILATTLPMFMQGQEQGYTVDDWQYVQSILVVLVCSQGLAGLLAALPIMAANARSRKAFDLITLRIFSFVALIGVIATMAYPMQSGALGADGAYSGTVYALCLLLLICVLGLLIVSLVTRSSREHRQELPAADKQK